MFFAIATLVVFVVLIIEIPFSLFLNFSIDRVLLEYMLESPIKLNGYAYIKNGELFHGTSKSESEGGVDTVKLLEFIEKRLIVKTFHLRAILGEEEVEKSMLESVMFKTLASVILSRISQSHPEAKLSQSQHIDAGEDKNIFVQTAFWLSTLDIASIALWYMKERLINKEK